MERRVALFLTTAAVLWTVAIVLAPLLHRHETGLTLSRLIRAAGAVVCHQRVERSFQIDGQTMPVCARCTGLYLSGAAGALAAWMIAPRMPRRTRTIMLIAVVPTAATLVAEWAGLAQPGNIVRAVAAVPAGAACGWVFVRMLRAEAAPSTFAIIT